MTNPATIPTPVKDIQGDGRWMSMVSIYLKFENCVKLPLLYSKMIINLS